MNIYKKTTVGAVPIRMAVTALIVASLLIMPAISEASNHTEQNINGQGRAYGRSVVIPPLIIFLSNWEDEYGWLPPGLARLLERFEHHFGPIDDDDDEQDPTDPELENVVEDVAETTATLQFEFSEDVRVRLFVSTETGFAKTDGGVIRQSHTNYDNEHQFELEDLETDTDYFYRVEFRDEDGNTIMSDEMSFTTDAASSDTGDDTTDPVVESLTVEVSTSTANVEISFDEPTQVRLMISKVDGFSTGTSDVMTFSHTDYEMEHSFMVDELIPETEYFYRIRYRDEAGNVNLSNQMSFTTDATEEDDDEEDTTAPVVESITVEVGTSTVEMDVVLDEPARVRLLVSEVDGFNNGTEGVVSIDHSDYLTEHSFMVDELTPDTEYFYRIRSQDEAGNANLGAQMSFTTAAEEAEDTTGPIISAIAGEAGTSTITGTFTTDEPARAAIHTASTSGFSIGDAGVIVTQDATLKTDHELMITGLASSTTYYHIIVVEDEPGNTTESEEFTFGTN